MQSMNCDKRIDRYLVKWEVGSGRGGRISPGMQLVANISLGGIPSTLLGVEGFLFHHLQQYHQWHEGRYSVAWTSCVAPRSLIDLHSLSVPCQSH